MNDPRLERAKSAIESGDRAAAGRILMAMLNDDPRNEVAWLWMSRVVSDPRRKHQCLETVLEINPHNDEARTALLRLQAREMVQEEEDRTSQTASPPQARARPTSGPPPQAQARGEQPEKSASGNNRWLYLIGGILLVCVCCASPLWVFSNVGSALNDVVSEESSSERRVIPPTYTPSSGGGRPAISSGSSRDSAPYGQIAISRPTLAEYAERSALSMSFYRDLDYTDGTYHHTMCTRDCQQKLVMRSETFDRDDLDNLDFSFIYADEDEFTVRSLALINIVGLAIPAWDGLADWYLDSAETYLRGGRETFYASNNGVDVQLDFFYDAVDLEDAVIVSVME